MLGRGDNLPGVLAALGALFGLLPALLGHIVQVVRLLVDVLLDIGLGVPNDPRLLGLFDALGAGRSSASGDDEDYEN